MNLSFDEQQEMMRRSFRSFLEDRYPVQQAREYMENKKEIDRTLWDGITELGIPGILVDEQYGGLGLTPIDQLVIQEEAGRFLTPAPIKANAIAAFLLNRSGNVEAYREVLEGICEGKTICTIGMLEGNWKWDEPTVKVRTNANGYVLNGTKIAVPFAAMSDYALVTAKDEQEGIGLYLVSLSAEGVTLRRLKTVDGTQPWYEVRFENVQLEKDRKLTEGETPYVEQAMQLGVIFTCAEAVGAMERVLAMTSQYAKDRVQFGKPIGSFQAVKHKLADMLVGIEFSKALTYFAALEMQEKTDSRVMSLASAKVYCIDTYHTVVREGVQLHGGMGYTWENDMHLFLKRSIVNQSEFGDQRQYKQIISKEMKLMA